MPRLTDRDGGMDWKERERVLWRKRFDFSQFSLSSVMLAVLVISDTDCSLQRRG